MSVEVKVFKTAIGEEIIGAVETHEGGVWVVTDPLGIGIDQREGKLVFVPYMPYTSAAQKLVIYETALLFEPLDPVDSIYDDYINATRKIAVPGRSGKILTPVK
jgi:hypothetical protein